MMLHTKFEHFGSSSSKKYYCLEVQPTDAVLTTEKRTAQETFLSIFVRFGQFPPLFNVKA